MLYNVLIKYYTIVQTFYTYYIKASQKTSQTKLRQRRRIFFRNIMGKLIRRLVVGGWYL